MDTDDGCHSDQSRLLYVLYVVSSRHNIANVTLSWLLNYLQKISSTPYSDQILKNVISVMECVQSIVEHLSVLCDNDCDDIEYFKPFLLDMLTMFIDPTLTSDNVTDPHMFTNSLVLSKFATLLRVGIQGVNRCINILEFCDY